MIQMLPADIITIQCGFLYSRQILRQLNYSEKNTDLMITFSSENIKSSLETDSLVKV